ncbi:probable jasmonic acid carboxyl methyltransferase 2, partial [Triticum aestivum]
SGNLRLQLSGSWAFCKQSPSKQMVHMNQGQGETSYARNSAFQSAQQNRMKLLIEAAIIDLGSNTNTLLPQKVVIADLGCSTGPNALALVSIAIKAIQSYCLQLQQPSPELLVLLNDLPDNDFNMVVKSLVTLRQSKKPLVMIGVTPGSFYERLFTSSSLHLVCSSSSLQWLSKAPEVLARNHIPAYDIDEKARRERLPIVLQAYAEQFRKDFTHFLELRAKELAPGGQMVVSIIGRRFDGIASFHIWEIITQVLSVMASEGVIDKEKFNSFYMPMYGPSNEELKEIIHEEGSFSIREMLVHDFTGGINKELITPAWTANQLRAVFEQILAQHFGDLMDDFVKTSERCWSVEGRLHDELARLAMLTVSVSKA